jgi:transposase
MRRRTVFEQCYWPFEQEDDLDRVPEALSSGRVQAAQPWSPGSRRSELTEALADCARTGRHHRAVRGNLLEAVVCLPHRQLPDAAGRNPRRAHEFLDRLTEIHLADLEKYLAAVVFD